jgi:hypothetical protein
MIRQKIDPESIDFLPFCGTVFKDGGALEWRW